MTTNQKFRQSAFAIFFIGVWTVSFFSCGGPSDTPDAKMKKLDELRAEKAKLESEIALLEKELGDKDTSAEVPVSVKVTAPRTGVFLSFAEFQGVVSSEENINLGSEVGGRITRLSVKEGQTVSKGQVLANFDDELIQKTIYEVENALDLATTAYQKQKNLWDQKIGSEMQYLQAKNQKENLEKRMESLRAQQGKAALRSPISGTVDKIYLNPGEMAGPGMPVMRVVNNDRVKIVADIPERFVGKFKNGDSVGVKLAAVERVVSGRIRSVGQVIDVANRTFNLVVDPDSKSGREFLKPNMLAVVKIVTYKNKEAISVPTDLIRFEQEGTFIDVVEAGVVKRIPVETGEVSEGFTEILSGLNGGEQIISEGLKSVSVGASVKVINP